MKTAQEHLIEAAARAAASGPLGARAATPVSAADAEGWMSSLAQGLRGSELGGAALRPTSSSEQQTSTQLLAAAHAVAAYWQSAGQLLHTAAETAAASSGASQAPIIRVTHVTAEGGLGAVELAHPDLGALALEVSLSGRTLSVLATAETEHAAAAIREGQAALALRLQAQGIVLQTLEVVVLRRRAPNQNRKPHRKDS